MHSIVEQQQQAYSVQTKSVSAEEKARKAAILAQYAQVCDGDAYPTSVIVMLATLS